MKTSAACDRTATTGARRSGHSVRLIISSWVLRHNVFNGALTRRVEVAQRKPFEMKNLKLGKPIENIFLLLLLPLVSSESNDGCPYVVLACA